MVHISWIFINNIFLVKNVFIFILILFSLKTISKSVLGSINRGWAQNHLPIPTTFRKTSNTYMEYKPASIVGFLLAVFLLLLIFYKISFNGKMILIICIVKLTGIYLSILSVLRVYFWKSIHRYIRFTSMYCIV